MIRKIAIAALIVSTIKSGLPGGTIQPTDSSSTTCASSESGSQTATIGLPAARMLYMRLGTETPDIPDVKEMIAASQAFRNMC